MTPIPIQAARAAAAILATAALVLLAACGGSREHEDPRAAAGQGAAHPVTVHDRQVAVEHDHVIRRLPGGLQRRRAVMHGVHGHPGLAQPLSNPAGQRRMVLDHQHPHPAIMRPPA